jgi:hypothetical protein
VDFRLGSSHMWPGGIEAGGAVSPTIDYRAKR